MRFITNDSFKILLSNYKVSVIRSKPLYFISFYLSVRKANCENLIFQQANILMLKDGEIQHRQHEGYHSDSFIEADNFKIF